MQRRAPRAPSSQTRTGCAHVPPSLHHAQHLSDSPMIGSPCCQPARCGTNTFSLIPPTGDTRPQSV
ncbi:hypothetical protein BGY98DRAFT_1021457, partial [Russula aff. rugulosa BPL654]